MDIFVIDSVFLGKLSSIRIGHSETKLGTFRKNLSLLLFTMCVSLFHHFIIVINEAPRKFFFFLGTTFGNNFTNLFPLRSFIKQLKNCTFCF